MGGISYLPYFAPYTRYIVEYDGCGMNVGMDALLWKHCMIQLATGHFKSFQAGIAYQINLLGKNKKRKWKMDYKREDVQLRDSMQKRHWDITDFVDIPLSR